MARWGRVLPAREETFHAGLADQSLMGILNSPVLVYAKKDEIGRKHGEQAVKTSRRHEAK